jgi:hypothetical protein
MQQIKTSVCPRIAWTCRGFHGARGKYECPPKAHRRLWHARCITHFRRCGTPKPRFQWFHQNRSQVKFSKLSPRYGDLSPSRETARFTPPGRAINRVRRTPPPTVATTTAPAAREGIQLRSLFRGPGWHPSQGQPGPFLLRGNADQAVPIDRCGSAMNSQHGCPNFVERQSLDGPRSDAICQPENFIDDSGVIGTRGIVGALLNTARRRCQSRC